MLFRSLGAENVNVPGGLVRDGDNEYLVRTLNEVRRVDEIAALEVRRADGTRVPLREVGTIREAHKDREVQLVRFQLGTLCHLAPGLLMA